MINTPSSPVAIAVDSVRKRIFVALTAQNRVAVYLMTPPYTLIQMLQ